MQLKNYFICYIFLENEMNYTAILYEIKENILTITLNRPEKLNAFNKEMQDDLIHAIDRANKDDEV